MLRVAVGYGLLALPFIVLTGAIVHALGWREALLVWAILGAVLLSLTSGALLITP